MNIGNRIYYNHEGEILFQAGEIENGELRPVDEVVNYIDVDYGAVDYSTSQIISIDIETKQPVIQWFAPETAEEKRIRELEEDIELLKADAEIGGIL
ncbi:hypothetical protein P9B03_17860 [Metasolibacillus meyeri]|uniref:Phage protein n=1 Tax=Metasolibacillus meyeri TaxID=1071052 RepID=A0AAW9NNF7_9BACL|nr:hypothetical protein [Metasolibacillus meyeri]MEC1180364.1 hypothetical protein [Metasolibacillus meyeri]